MTEPVPTRERFYITTAIDYPNSRPHIGTAFEKIGADVQARFRRMQGFDVHFQMGNDENTIKVEQRAEELGLDPKAYVDDMAGQFLDVWRALDVSCDGFIQTSEPRHHVGCQLFIQKVFDAGHIYKKLYQGLYCTGCESFKTETELAESGGACPNHPTTPLKHVEEENYFFRLSSFAERLLDHYAANPRFIQPESRRNEIVSLVKSGLQDIAISRKGYTWGIPVPFDEEQTIYVWFDALLNYLTAVGYGTGETGPPTWWPADVHVIGKDITRFHCALWPAMLMAAGLPLPKQVFAHGFVYNKGAKMSKTLGNVVDPKELAVRFGPDAFRYYFMSQCPFGGDGEFSDERFVATYNADLADKLGNLYSRMLAMCLKYFQGELRGVPAAERTAWRAQLDWPELVASVTNLVETFQYNVALQRVWLEVVDAANKYITTTEPFKLVKKDPEGAKVVLANLAEAARAIAVLLKPFIPRTAETFYKAFDFESAQPWATVRYADVLEPGAADPLRVTAPLVEGKVVPMFPKIEVVKGP